MNTEEVVVTTLDGRPMRAYVAWPDSTRALRPAVVLGELFGLNDVQRSAADRVAAMGHVAIAPTSLHHLVVDAPLPADGDRKGEQHGWAVVCPMRSFVMGRLVLRHCRLGRVALGGTDEDSSA